MSIADDQIEFHEIGPEVQKTNHAFHSDGYKIKGKHYGCITVWKYKFQSYFLEKCTQITESFRMP